jgi:hypothetical protein
MLKADEEVEIDKDKNQPQTAITVETLHREGPQSPPPFTIHPAPSRYLA